MALRFFVYGLIFASLTACDSAPPPGTFTSSLELQKEVVTAGNQKGIGEIGHATVNLSVKFDRTARQRFSNVGVAYFRVDISNPSDYLLSVGAVYVQFVDAMEISIQKCKLSSRDIKPFGHRSIQVKPGESFSASSSCGFPISQIEAVEEVVGVVGFGFLGLAVGRKQINGRL